MDSDLKPLLLNKKLIVCCGAGGVGKTTIASALALAGARLGKKTLVMTIDPSKRLAQTLQISSQTQTPVEVPFEPKLNAWVLNSKWIADQAVCSIIKDPESSQKLLQNPIYQQLSQMVAGMHEYTAMKALYHFLDTQKYDLIVLDTPPSRHALDFINAPSRVAQFLEGKIFKLFLPKPGQDGLLKKMASSLVQSVFSKVMGPDFSDSLLTFFGSFSGIFASLNQDLSWVRTFLGDPDKTAFVLISSPHEMALEEAHFFENQMASLHLPFSAYILNKIGNFKIKSLATNPLPNELSDSARALWDFWVQSEINDQSHHQRTLDKIRTELQSWKNIVFLAIPPLFAHLDDDTELPKLQKISEILCNS